MRYRLRGVKHGRGVEKGILFLGLTPPAGCAVWDQECGRELLLWQLCLSSLGGVVGVIMMVELGMIWRDKGS